MKIYTVVTGRIGENAYIIDNDFTENGKKQAILIDPGDDSWKIKSELDAHGLIPAFVLLTHEHYDHTGACAVFQKMGAKVYMHKTAQENMQKGYHLGVGQNFEDFEPDNVFGGDTELSLCGLKIKVLYTPGHTSGGVCYLIEDVIFTGDTLFHLDIGRTDLPTGDYDAIIDSIKNKLFCLSGNYRILPGHEQESDLYTEKLDNPYLKNR